MRLSEYDFRHLVHHLARARRDAELHWLLGLEATDGANAWFRARDAQAETAGYLEDIEQARELADDAATRRLGDRRASAVGMQCRYALMGGAFNEAAASISPSLSARLVEAGQWTQEQALTYATRARSEDRLDIVVGALARESGARRDVLAREALAAARPVAENVERIGHVVEALAENLPDALLAEMLELIRRVSDERTRGHALEAVAPRLPAALTRQARGLAEAIEDPGVRAEALAAVAARLPETEAAHAFDAAVKAARHAPEPFGVLVKLADRLPIERAASLPLIANDLPDESYPRQRLEVFIAVMGRYAEEQPLWAFEQLRQFGEFTSPIYWTALDRAAIALAHMGRAGEALEAARTIPELARAQTLERLASIVPRSVQSNLVEEACALPEHLRPQALGAVAREADENSGRAVLEAADSIGDSLWRRRALAWVAPALSGMLGEQAMKAAFDAAAAASDGEALKQIAPALPPSLTADALTLIFDPAKHQRWLPFAGETIGAVAARLAELGEPRAALNAVRAIRDSDQRNVALGALAAQLPAGMLGEVRGAIEPPRHESACVSAHTAIAGHLPLSLRKRLTRRAAALADPVERIDALLGIASSLPEQPRGRVLETALATLHQISHASPQPQLQALDRILRELPADLADRATDAAERIARRDRSLSAVVAVARHVEAPSAHHAWHVALAIARGFRSIPHRERTLVWLAPQLPPTLHEELLDSAKSLHEDARARILVAIAGNLPTQLCDRALTETHMMSIGYRLVVLGCLLARLQPATRQEVVDSTYAQLEANSKAYEKGWLFEAAVELGPHDRSEARTDRAESALAWARDRSDNADRAMALATLAGALPAAVERRADVSALEAAMSVGDGALPKVLRALALQLPPARLENVIRFAEARLTPLEAEDTDRAHALRFDVGDALGELALRAARAKRAESALVALRLLPELRESEVLERLVPLLPVSMLGDAATLTHDINILGAIAVRLAAAGSWNEALAQIGAILDRYDRGRSSADDPAAPVVRIAAIAPRARLTELLALARRLPEDEQARALPPIVARLPRSERRAVLEQALESTNTDLLASLTSHAARLPARVVVGAWSRSLRRAAQAGRLEVLDCVRALDPAIAAVCGSNAAVAIHDALDAVDRWWWPADSSHYRTKRTPKTARLGEPAET